MAFRWTVMALLAVGPGRAASAPTPADAALKAARDDYADLKKDEKRRQFRHHWQNVAHRFEAVAQRFPKSERAPEALFLAGDLLNELNRFSGNPDDLVAADKVYRRLLDGWPKHRLADDAALSLAHVLADRRDDAAGARKVLEAAIDGANDRKKELKAFLASLEESARTRKGAPQKEAAARDEPARAASAPEKPKVVAAAPPPRPAAAPAAAPVAARGGVAEAIRKLTATSVLVSPSAEAAARARQAEREQTEQEAALRKDEAQARRVPAPRPREDDRAVAEATHGSEDVDENSASAIASLQERLRDVRVGARRVPDEGDARSRFKQLARDEASSEVTLSQQLGLKVRRIVIDPGHGGHDAGATGLKGTREKDVALGISKKLAARLEEQGLEVVLTREDDTFVKLEDRAAFANKEKGDLFISIHCNAASSRRLRGIETYTLNISSNRYSMRLAARENASSEKGVSDLQYILADLATKANTGESTRLAERVQRGLVRSLAAEHKDVVDLGTKEALFFVLLGAKMPSILVETSFISNPEDEQRLKGDEYQAEIAASIADSVGDFLEERNKLAQLE